MIAGQSPPMGTFRRRPVPGDRTHIETSASATIQPRVRDCADAALSLGVQNEEDVQRSSTEMGVSHSLAAPFSRIVLTGFMGAGKSTVGQLLSRAMRWGFLDLDQYIESFAGATARDIFTGRGESAFRRLESDALALAMEGTETIIALGGAAIDATENHLLLLNSRHTLIVFLDAPFATLMERCLVRECSGTAPYRPLLHQTERAYERFLFRRSLYQGRASIAVDVVDRSAEEVALLIWNTACKRQS